MRQARRGLGGVYQRGGTWWVRYYHRGKKFRESVGRDELGRPRSRGDAVRLLKRRLGEMGQGRFVGPQAEKVTFEDLKRMVLHDYDLNRRKSTPRVKLAFRTLDETFARALALDITTDRLTTYALAREEERAYPATVKYELAALRRGFRLAVRAGWLNTVPAFPTIKVQNARVGFFEKAEFERVLASLPEEVRPLVEFLYFTGWRKGEVLGLEWRSVDFAAGTICLEVGTTKNGRGRLLPFRALPALAELLRRQRERTDAVERERGIIVPSVFHRNGKPISDFRGAWEVACRAAGVPGRIVHDFRRTAARNLIRAGVPERVAMEILGHKTRSIFDRYNIVNDRDVAEGLSKLAKAQEALPVSAETKVMAFQAQRAAK
jgi:integrase